MPVGICVLFWLASVKMFGMIKTICFRLPGLLLKIGKRSLTLNAFKIRSDQCIEPLIGVIGIKSNKSGSFVKIDRFRYHKCLHSVDLGNGLRNDVRRCANGFLCPLGFILSG